MMAKQLGKQERLLCLDTSPSPSLASTSSRSILAGLRLLFSRPRPPRVVGLAFSNKTSSQRLFKMALPFPLALRPTSRVCKKTTTKRKAYYDQKIFFSL